MLVLLNYWYAMTCGGPIEFGADVLEFDSKGYPKKALPRLHARQRQVRGLYKHYTQSALETQHVCLQ